VSILSDRHGPARARIYVPPLLAQGLPQQPREEVGVWRGGVFVPLPSTFPV